jgi:hypothetical protein
LPEWQSSDVTPGQRGARLAQKGKGTVVASARALVSEKRLLMEIAIFGLGSWGLSFLERIVTGSRSQWGPVRVHIVEFRPARPARVSMQWTSPTI